MATGVQMRDVTPDIPWTLEAKPRTAYLNRDLLEDEGKRDTLTFVASTAGVKRDGLDLRMDGLTTDNFEKNPVFLWVHDDHGRTLPLGKVEKIRKLKSRFDVTVEFDQADPFAVEVERKYRDGYLNAVSIGWDIIEWHRVEDDEDSEADYIVDKWDLLDVSAVPVPGDPEALITTQRTYLDSLGVDFDRQLPAPPGAVDADVLGETMRELLEVLRKPVTEPIIDPTGSNDYSITEWQMVRDALPGG